MGLATFIQRALVLSINVTLRMFVMLAVSAFGIYLLASFLWDYPFGLFFVLALTFFPGLVFLYLSCVRAGLVGLKASGPPNMKKLGSATIKLFRFNVMINNLITTLVCVGVSVLIMVYLTPTIWADLSQEFQFSDLADFGEVAARFIQMPLAVFLTFALALSISTGVIGTSSASVAASAAENGPSHPPLWGITRQFLPLFILSMLVLFVPALIVIMLLGGPLEPIFNVAELSFSFYVALPIYIIWAGCAICAGKALAYVQTVKDMESEWVKEREDMLGDVVPEENIRSLRLERQEARKMKDDSALPREDDPEFDPDTLDPFDDLELPDDTMTLDEEVPSIETEDVTSDVEPDIEVASQEQSDDIGYQSEEAFRRAVEEQMAKAEAAKAAKPKRKKAKTRSLRSRLTKIRK